jgi:hypothetical protein
MMGPIVLLTTLLFALLIVSCSPVQSKSTELTFELPDNAKQCYHEDIAAGTKATIEYQVVTGGYYDVDMTLYDPRQAVLYQGVKKQFDTHQWTASMSGQYTFCFSNEFSTFSHKLIYFEFIAGEEDPLPQGSNPPAATAMTKFEAAAESIHENLNSIFDALTHYRLSEAKGRKRAEDLNSRVFWWSAMETIAVVLIGAIQVYTLKSFFSGHRASIPTT